MVNLLRLPKREFHSLENQYASDISPIIRRLHRQTAIFIDNVDEFFEQELYRHIDDSKNLPFYRSLWNASQIGIALAVRDLHLINPHIKVYASIRKEVLPDLTGTSSLSTQIKGYSIDINYGHGDLEEIIEKNILNSTLR